VLELSMATPRRDQEPAVVVEEAQQVTHFHSPTLELAPSLANAEILRESLDCRLTVELSGAHAGA
jgi:hypothetical protein